MLRSMPRVAALVLMALRPSLAAFSRIRPTPFDNMLTRTGPTTRTDLCGRARAVVNDTIGIENALNGLHLHIGTFLWSPSFLQIHENGKATGHEVELMEALAAKGGFTYDVTLLDPILGNFSSWTEALLFTMTEYDMITASYWQISNDYSLSGAFSPYGFLDYSNLFARRKPSPAVVPFKEKILQCLFPFRWEVWGVFIVLAVFTACLYILFEGKTDEDTFPDQGIGQKSVRSLYMALSQVAGNPDMSLSPQTWSGKILLLSWAWCVFLFMAAYTANLVSFLVLKPDDPVGLRSIEEAVASSAKICSNGGWDDLYMHQFPDYEHLFDNTGTDFTGFGGELRALVHHRCDVTLVGRFKYDLLKDSREVNNDCEIEVMGTSLSRGSGGYMVYGEYHEACTVLIRDALNVIFMQLEGEGVLQELYEELTEAYYTRASTTSCASQREEEEAGDADRLDLVSMGGIIILYLAGAGLALVIFCLRRTHQHGKRISRSLSNVLDEAGPDSADNAVGEAPAFIAEAQTHQQAVGEAPVFIQQLEADEKALPHLNDIDVDTATPVWQSPFSNPTKSSNVVDTADKRPGPQMSPDLTAYNAQEIAMRRRQVSPDPLRRNDAEQPASRTLSAQPRRDDASVTAESQASSSIKSNKMGGNWKIRARANNLPEALSAETTLDL